MASTEGETSHMPGDDFAAEVSDLDPARVDVTGDAPVRPRVGLEVLASIAAPRDGRLARQRRTMRQLTIVGVVALALLVVLGSFPGIRGRASTALFGVAPTPSATLEQGAGYVYVAAGPAWARVTIDGRPVARLPIIGVDRPLWLPRGRHQITWQATPFAPIHCTLSTPIAGSDTCPYDRIVVSQPAATSGQWVITLFPTLAMLAAEQRAALADAAQAALDTLSSSATIQPGERYSTLYAYLMATRPLRATLSFQLVTDATQVKYCVNGGGDQGCSALGQDCVQFCTVPAAGSVGYWSIYAVAHMLWTFATPSGQVVTTPQNDVYDGSGTAGVLVPLRVTWDGAHWAVTAQTTEPPAAYISYLNPPIAGVSIDPACLTLQQEINNQGLLPTPTDSLYDILTWRDVAAPQRADGCVAIATAGDFAVVPTPSVAPPAALLLRRFGVVLAANAVAQQLWPSLPVADAAEQQLAQKLAAQLVGSATGGTGSSR
jgi:hypothetical protein